jgi:hypothetical protein
MGRGSRNETDFDPDGPEAFEGTLMDGLDDEPVSLCECRAALKAIIALVPTAEEAFRVADTHGAEVANALTLGAWRAAEVARAALGEKADA